MAMLWLPMLFLTMLAPAVRALDFEKSLVRILAVSLWLNLVYAVMQIASTVGFVPRAALITSWLAPWSVDKNYDIVQGIRPAGFFANSTALSVFGIVSLCFFYARFVVSGSRQNLVHSLLAVGIVVLTTSRTAYAATAVILFAGWWHLPRGRQFAFAAIALTGAAALLVLIEKTIGLDVAFSRFERLADAGLLEDVSFGTRVYDTWPTALAAARDYHFGTLIQTPRALPLIDSGYLTYYLQGKWPFVAAVAGAAGGPVVAGLARVLRPAFAATRSDDTVSRNLPHGRAHHLEPAAFTAGDQLRRLFAVAPELSNATVPCCRRCRPTSTLLFPTTRHAGRQRSAELTERAKIVPSAPTKRRTEPLVITVRVKGAQRSHSTYQPS